MKKKNVETLWGSAFSEKPEAELIAFLAGRDVWTPRPADEYLVPFDIWGSKAHSIMLHSVGLLESADLKVLLEGLNTIEMEFAMGTFHLDPAKEDVHSNIESLLTARHGIEQVGKLHTARSRNDQSNLDMRLFVREHVLLFIERMLHLVNSLLKLAGEHKQTIMPGFTHHQHAMVTTLGHVFMASAVAISRDIERFRAWYPLHNTNPLGLGAGYGTSHPIDQKLTTELLAFDSPDLNSIDRITNRWEAEADFGSASLTMMNHLSSLAQTLIVLSMPEARALKIADSYSTGSSIMPQKKNPDPLEVLKGKTAFISGLVQSLYALGAQNFMGYNRDSQWTKYGILDIILETQFAPSVMAGLTSSMKVDKSRLAELANESFVGATSLLEYLTFRYKIPFRIAKIIVERAIKSCEGREKVSVEAINSILTEESTGITLSSDEVLRSQDPQHIVNGFRSIGSSHPAILEEARHSLSATADFQARWLREKRGAIDAARTRVANFSV